MAIKDLRNKQVKLTGKQGIDRQKAIIFNQKLNIGIANKKIEKAKAQMTKLELKGAKKALGTNSNDKLIKALKQIRSINADK